MTAPTRTIAATGTGTAEAVPDLLTLSVGVECRREHVAAAYNEAGTLSASLSSVLRQHGVANADIRTSGLNVRADLVWQEGHGQTVSGYVASSLLTVRLRNVSESGEIIAAAIAAGGNDVRLHGLELSFAESSDVEARAREAAWNDALTTAKHYAGLAGTELGSVVSLSQQPATSLPIPLSMAKIERTQATDSLRVEAGESSVSAVVNVVWELKDAD